MLTPILPGPGDYLRFPAERNNPQSPEYDEPEAPMTYQEASEQALAALESIPESLADWLAKQCDNELGRKEIDWHKVPCASFEDAPTPVLLAVLWNAPMSSADTPRVLLARYELRRRYAAHLGPDVAARVKELME